MRGRVLADGVDAEADLVADVGLQDLDGALRVVAVDQQVRADELVVGDAQPVARAVDYDGDFEPGEARELDGDVC